LRFSPLKKLADRILMTVITLVVLMTALFISYFTLHNRRTLEDYEGKSSASLTKSLAEASRLGIIASEPIFLEQPFQIAMDNPMVAFVAAYDVAGQLIDGRSRVSMNLEIDQQTMAIIQDIESSISSGTVEISDERIESFYAPVFTEQVAADLGEDMLIVEEEAEDKPLTTIGWVRLGFSKARLAASERAALIISLIIGAVMLILGALVAIFLSRRIARPLAELERSTRKIRDGNLDVTVPITREDEVAAVAKAFNTMTEALRETTVSKDYVDNIMASMNESMMVVGSDRRISTVNRALQDMLAYDSGEIVGLPADAVFYDAENHPMSESRWSTVLTVASSNMTANFRTKDGHRIPVTISTAPLADKSGEVHGIVTVARDMREINALLEKLRSHASELENYQSVLFSMLDDNEKSREEIETERAKMETAVESMVDGLILFDPQGRLALVNASAKAMLELDEKSKNDASLILARLGGIFDNFVRKYEDMGDARITHELTLGVAARRTVRIEGISVGASEHRTGTMLIMRDVTRQKELDEAKYELISNVSHELRTPLAIISNVISNALVGVLGEIDEKVRKNLETCHNNAKRLSRIIDSLLSVSSMDKGGFGITRRRGDLCKVLREVALQYEERAAEKSLALRLQLPRDSVACFFDQEKMREVIGNLVSNAIKFTEHGGVTIICIAKAEQAEVAVIDTGRGIPRDQQLSIFEQFHQVGRAYGPGEKGVGLGLPISKKLIEQHGGSISLTSSPGTGSRFAFTLPLLKGGDIVNAYISDRLGRVAAAPVFLWAIRPRSAVISDEGARVKALRSLIEAIELKVAKHEHLLEVSDDPAIIFLAVVAEVHKKIELLERELGISELDTVGISAVICDSSERAAEQYLKELLAGLDSA